MSRQSQNALMAGLACAVAAVAMIAVTLAMNGGDGSTVASVDPASGGAGRIEADQATTDATDGEDTPLALADPDVQAATRSTLDVSRSTPSSSSTSLSRSSTTAAPSTAAPTTAAPTTAAPTTAAPSTETTTAATSETTIATSADSETTTASTAASGGNDPNTTAEATTSTAVQSTKPPTTRPPVTLPPETSAPTTTGGGSLNAIEREIARLTNELRTNPNGSLKRQGPVINCGGRIRVNGAGNGYEAIGALSLHEGASLQVARPWSAQMSRSNFKHRPNAGVDALQAIGISIRSAGENIAYHSYSDKAMTHFTGWRESDGHFCNMMDPGFTHIGVGEVTKSDGLSYATQNFFSTR